uniref:Uncharacterized protein LOC113789542 n=1 Tax=Dermatophagoides pteronyssinus TaxID=6956 RepID=A0A6P6XSL4_DERPT|nr:uncharacterized protein LOC113789542 [Dermatophagoides pteronyssinus]
MMSQSLVNDINDRTSKSLLSGNNWHHLRNKNNLTACQRLCSNSNPNDYHDEKLNNINFDDYKNTITHHCHKNDSDDNEDKVDDELTTPFDKVQSSSSSTLPCRLADCHTATTSVTILANNTQTFSLPTMVYTSNDCDDYKDEVINGNNGVDLNLRRSARIKQYSTGRNMRNIHTEQDFIYDWPGSGHHFHHLSDPLTIATDKFSKNQRLITNNQLSSSSSSEVITQANICNGNYNQEDIHGSEDDITQQSSAVMKCTRNQNRKSRSKMNDNNENGIVDYDDDIEMGKEAKSVAMTASGNRSVTDINIDKNDNDNNNSYKSSIVPDVIDNFYDKNGHIVCNGNDKGPTTTKLSSSDDFELLKMDEQLATNHLKSKNAQKSKHPTGSIIFDISRPLFNFETQFESNQILFQDLTREIKTAKQLSHHSKQRHRKRNKRRSTGNASQKLTLLNRKEVYKSSQNENDQKDSRKVAKRPVRMQPRMAVFNVARNVKNSNDVILKDDSIKSNEHPTQRVQIKKEESIDKEDRFFRKIIRKLNPKNTQEQSASIKTNSNSDLNIANDENSNKVTINHTPSTLEQKHPLAKKSIVKRYIDQLSANDSETSNKSDVIANSNCDLEFDDKNQLIGRNFSIYQRLFQLYKLCEYNHLNSPLYLTSSLSYMKHFECEYNAAFGPNDHNDGNLNGIIQQDNSISCNDNGNEDIDMDENQQSTPNPLITDINGQPSANKNKNINDVNASDDEQDERIVSTALVLDPLALNSIIGYDYATIDFFVLRRQGPNTMLDSDVFDDSKIYVGTSCVHFGSKFSRIINNRIIIPIKLLFELDQIDSNEFVHSSEDYKYFINAVVTYFRCHSQLKSQFMANCRRLNGQQVRSLSPNKSNKKSLPPDQCLKLKSSNNNAQNDLNDKMEFHFGFELENIEDIHYTKELPSCHDKQIVDNNKHRKRRSQLIKGEETHMLWQSEMPRLGHKPRINIVTELNKWHRITSDDIFYRDNSKDSQCGYYGYRDCKRKLRPSPRKDGNFKHQIEMNFITFRLLRTNFSNNSDENEFSSNLKKLYCKVGSNSIQQTISAKQLISIFNDGQFITWKKLAQARSHNDDDNKIDSKDSQLKNQRVLRANTRRQAAAAAVSSVSAQNLTNSDSAQENSSMSKPIIPRLIHEKDSFKIVYEFSQIQSNLISEDISCPLCSRQFVMLAQLAVHLTTNHERFRFRMTMDPMNRFISIHVGLNEQFDPTFDTDPLLKALNYCPRTHQTQRRRVSRMRCTRPERRPTTNHQPATMMITIGRDHRSLCTMFTYNDEGRYYQIDVNHQIGSYEALSQRRVFYHSRTMLPILPAEMEDDSETDEIQWRMRQKRHMMQDFIDVNPGEKAVMGLWNQFIMKYRNRYFADCHMSDAVKNFMVTNTPMLIRCNLRHNCILHLINMYRYKCIDQDVVDQSVRYLNKMQSYYERCQEMLQRRKHPLDRLPDSLIKMMQYFQVKDTPIEYLSDISVDGDGEKNHQLYDIDIIAKLFDQSEIDQIFGPDAHLFLPNKSKNQRTIRMINNLEAIALLALLSLGDGNNVQNTITLNRGFDQLKQHVQQVKQSYNSNRMAEMYLNQSTTKLPLRLINDDDEPDVVHTH